MTRNQWAITTVLALATALVFGCFGVYLHAYLTGGTALDSPAPVQLTDVATDSPADTLEPTPAGSAANYGYRLCFQDVAAGSVELVEDLGLAISSGTDDPLASCEEAARLQLQRRAAELRTAHQNCPVPLEPHLQAARRYLDSGLAESIEASDRIEVYCAGSKDAYWLGEASTHLDRARELGELADQEMQAYYTS
jgi:hypothetical protein